MPYGDRIFVVKQAHGYVTHVTAELQRLVSNEAMWTRISISTSITDE